MTWPSPQDYNEAIQTPSFSFEDADLKGGTPELDRFGLPKPISGGFASVYKVRGTNRDWAVRCFLHPVNGQNEHYTELGTFLAKTTCPYIVPFEFLEAGIRIRNGCYPILKMNWLNGLTLNGYIDENLCNPSVLNTLHQQFLTMFADLQNAGIVHGDLQHGNIMVVDGALKLVDYDCMYVDGMSFSESRELGHRNYQHPGRNSLHNGFYLDNFSAHVIDVSLRSLVIDPQLWHELKGGDECLLFRHRDFARPDQSRAFAILEHHSSDEIASQARALRFLAQLPIEAVPPPGSTITVPPDFELMPQVTQLPETNANEHWLASWLPPGQQSFSDAGIVVAISSHVRGETESSSPSICQLENITPKVRLIQTCCEYHPSLPTVVSSPRGGHEERLHQKAAIRQSVHARAQQHSSANRSGFFGLNYTHTTAWAEPPTVAEQLVKVLIAASVCLVVGFVVTTSAFSILYTFDFNGMRTGHTVGDEGFDDFVYSAKYAQTKDQLDETAALQRHSDAVVLVEEEKYIDAIPELEAALKELKRVHSTYTDIIGDCHKKLGVCYESSADYKKSLYHYKEAEKIIGPYFNEEGISSETWDVGRVALQAGDLKTARTYLEKASQFFETCQVGPDNIDPSKDTDILCLRDLEDCYRRLGLTDKAKKVHREWISLVNKRRLNS